MSEQFSGDVRSGGVMEQRSSVSIKTTAKGDPQVEVKVYTSDVGSVDAAKEKALAVYRELAEVMGL